MMQTARMSEESETVLSVRGEAQRTVEPDRLSLPGAVRVTAGTKADALRQVGLALAALTADLADLGGTALDATTMRWPLTWSVESTSTQPAHELDQATGQYVATGGVSAFAAVTVGVRAMELLDALSDVLARHDDLQLHDALWGVDDDNPAWPELRAEAIGAALRKGADYAAALGGTLVRVMHVADAGLLGGVADFGRGRPFWVEQQSGRGSGPGDAPSLTPMPQLMTAAIDARLLAAGVVLKARA
jgi:uncharacterized protein YggE